jgi:hypothetical protein
MTILFLAIADAHQKHDLHIRKSNLLNMSSFCMHTTRQKRKEDVLGSLNYAFFCRKSRRRRRQ